MSLPVNNSVIRIFTSSLAIPLVYFNNKNFVDKYSARKLEVKIHCQSEVVDT